MTNSIVYGFISLCLAIIIASCAQITPPTGGPRDTIPPSRISSNPDNQSINFEGKNITISFDEKIKTDKLKEQLIITPLIESKYDFLVKKNTFKISFDEPFRIV
ncbi:MAG: Ig-like domain-containing protein [Cyclobacteriaceae bacterium]|nr:Ig-like domain-containing protein [Cyclobacteriaceae bacterium]